jgi:hypothetical protein
VGLCRSTTNLNRLPGWEPGSWGYHGDDGHAFNNSGMGQPYGPTFTAGDVIGCGIDFTVETLFYTHNGADLGSPSSTLGDAIDDLYPTVGLRSMGERVRANFGKEDFMFDIEHYKRFVACRLC